MRRIGIRIAVAASAAVVIELICWFYLSTPHPDAKEVAVAQDAVYEAVVHDLITPIHGQPQIMQLVFSDELLEGSAGEGKEKSCAEDVKKATYFGASQPEINSLADKVYRHITRGGDDYSIRPETIQDFAEKDCAGGRLSETFHTDLPRTFIPPGSNYFGLISAQGTRLTSFEQQFHGADGIISFSRVGFDCRLDEAIVSTSFVCGMLCGSGHIYVLKRRRGRWVVVNKWMVWIS